MRLGVATGDQAQIRAELLRLPGVAAVETIADGEGDGLMIFPRGAEPIVADVADLGARPSLAVSGCASSAAGSTTSSAP